MSKKKNDPDLRIAEGSVIRCALCNAVLHDVDDLRRDCPKAISEVRSHAVGFDDFFKLRRKETTP